MYSDTHFHFNLMDENFRAEILTELAKKECFFGLDIGTHCDDLIYRQKMVKTALSQISDLELKEKGTKLINFSAGIWPAPEAIKNRFEQMKILEEQILQSKNLNTELSNKIIAIGECGLDHHWNPSGVDGRCESDFDQELFDGEMEMFKMHLELSKKMNLPVIVHSRDAFDGTVECIKDVGYDNGIIHCYSYGIEEAKVFLDRGWYLAFGGGVTYTKKSKMEQMEKLLQYVPEDRILLETDAPYLAPVPLRGKTNSPLLIENTYKFIADIRGIEVEKLSLIVDKNIKDLFRI